MGLNDVNERKLYKVHLEWDTYVVGVDEDDAVDIARREAVGDEPPSESWADLVTAGQPLPEDWKDCLPWGGDGETYMKDLWGKLPEPEPKAQVSGQAEPIRFITLPNPAVEHVRQFFAYAQLPPHLQAVSKAFHDLAEVVASSSSNPETTVALRKLLEGKDAAVRAVLIEKKS